MRSRLADGAAPPKDVGEAGFFTKTMRCMGNMSIVDNCILTMTAAGTVPLVASGMDVHMGDAKVLRTAVELFSNFGATEDDEMDAAATNRLLASSEDLGDGIMTPQLPRAGGKQAADSSPTSPTEREREARKAAKFTRDNLGGASPGGANLGGDGLGGDGLGGEGRDGENLGDAGLGDTGLGEGGLGEATEPAQGRRTSVKLNNRAYQEAEEEVAPPHLYVQARHLTELQGLALAAIFEPDAPEREGLLPTEATALYTARRAT